MRRPEILKQITQKMGYPTIMSALHKVLILKTPKQISQSKVVENVATHGET